MMRALLLALLLVGCTDTATEPPECPSADWCHHLDNDAVRDSLLPLPDSLP